MRLVAIPAWLALTLVLLLLLGLMTAHADKRVAALRNGTHESDTIDDALARDKLDTLKTSEIGGGTVPDARGIYPLTVEKERGLKPQDVFKECDACPDMVVVPAD